MKPCEAGKKQLSVVWHTVGARPPERAAAEREGEQPPFLVPSAAPAPPETGERLLSRPPRRSKVVWLPGSPVAPWPVVREPVLNAVCLVQCVNNFLGSR